MPDPWETEEPRPEVEEEEEDGGGPVKPFLEHLEDLRWVLIKCIVATMIAMLVCLFGAGKMVILLKQPLEEARKFRPQAAHVVTVWFGTNLLRTIELDTNRVAGLDLGDEQSVAVELTPVTVGTNQFLALKRLPEPPLEVDTGRGPNLIFLDPIAPFLSSLKIAFFGGIVLALPFLLYFVGDYVFPALKKKERKYFSRALIIGIGLFLAGVVFAYLVMLPLVLRAAESYAHWMGVGVVDWRAETYFSTVVMLMLAMGLAFELPVVLLALVKIGILDYPKLAGARRYSVVIAVVAGALLTPPDVISQILMAVPLLALYEVTVWIAWYWHKRDQARAAREAKRTGAEEASAPAAED